MLAKLDSLNKEQRRVHNGLTFYFLTY